MKLNQLKRSFVILIFLCLSISSSKAQKGVVHGKITLYNAIAVENAEVKVKKTQITAFTDSLGYFTIECKVKDKLSITAAGLDHKTVKVKNLKDSISIDLKVSKESDIDLAASEGHINGNEVNLAIKYFNTKLDYGFGYTNTIELILDKNPEIRYVKGEFIIRGINSFQGPNGALIVLNGVISDMGSIQGLPALEVKSTAVLNGSAASRYGAGASNGVVSVRTKSN